ncbi:MAG: hypothetical protein AAFP81_19615 [Pseudomonadota bacterium]
MPKPIGKRQSPQKKPQRHIIELDLAAGLRSVRWFLLRWQLYAIVGAIALIRSYIPYVDYLSDRDVHAEVCAEAIAAKQLSSLLASTEPFNMMDHQMLNMVTLVGDARIQSRPVMDMPVLYDGTQMPLRQHPALVRIINRDMAQEALAHTIADSFELRFCEWSPPWAPHQSLALLFKAKPPTETPDTQEHYLASVSH